MSIEKLIHSIPSPEPSHPLRENFTQNVMQRLPKKHFSALQVTFGHIPARLKTSLAIATAVIGISATASYAAALWLAPHVTLDQAQGISTLPNGDKRFWLTFSSCQGQDSPQPHKAYYEIKANASLTITQLAQGLVVSCEADLLSQLFPQAVHAQGQTKFTPYQTQYYFPYAQIKSITDSYMVVSLGLNGAQFTSSRLPIDTDAHFYEKGQSIPLSDLHPGDWLTLVSETHALAEPYATEQLRPDQLLRLSDHGMPIGSRILGAIKHVSDPNAELTIETLEGKEWTRLTPDKSSPDGWKQVVPLQ